MNIKGLKAELEKLNAKPWLYSIDGKLIPNTYILMYSTPKWFTFFYDEHGNVDERKEFLDEDSACHDLLERVTKTVLWQKKHGLDSDSQK